MGKTIKVIDLLTKILNREQPLHIRVYNRDWYWNNYDGYVTEASLSTTPDAQIYLFSMYRLDFALDKEVEIIEDEEIEKLSYQQVGYQNCDGSERKIKEVVIDFNKQVRQLGNKLNEVIEEVNKSKKERE